MTVLRVNPTEVFDGTPYGMSQGTVDDTTGLVFLSGQVAWDASGRARGDTFAEQVGHALNNLDTVLRAAGSGREHVLHVRIYLRGEVGDHMAEVAPLFAAYFGETRPAMTGIGVASLATPDTLVEIEVVAQRT